MGSDGRPAACHGIRALAVLYSFGRISPPVSTQESISAGIETINLRIYGIDRIMITTLTVLGLVINGGILYLDLAGA